MFSSDLWTCLEFVIGNEASVPLFSRAELREVRSSLTAWADDSRWGVLQDAIGRVNQAPLMALIK